MFLYVSHFSLRKDDDSEITEANERSPLKDHLSPWEEWFIGKEKELRAHLQARAAEVNVS